MMNFKWPCRNAVWNNSRENDEIWLFMVIFLVILWIIGWIQLIFAQQDSQGPKIILQQFLRIIFATYEFRK